MSSVRLSRQEIKPRRLFNATRHNGGCHFVSRHLTYPHVQRRAVTAAERLARVEIQSRARTTNPGQNILCSRPAMFFLMLSLRANATKLQVEMHFELGALPFPSLRPSAGDPSLARSAGSDCISVLIWVIYFFAPSRLLPAADQQSCSHQQRWPLFQFQLGSLMRDLSLLILIIFIFD